MAQIFVSSSGSQVIPGSTVDIKVQTQPGGTSAAGVLMLVGEADAGPDYTLEPDLQANSFGPDQVGAILAKYKSGPLVEAARFAAEPLADPQIPGSISQMILVKTNPSGKASHSLLAYDASTYGTLYDKSYGKLGNLIYYQVLANATEAIPTTGPFTYIPAVGTVNANLRANGGSALAATLSANTTPVALVSALDALSGVAATGGAARTTIQASVGTLAVGSISGNSAVITYASSTFTTTPVAGDTVVIPSGSAIAGAGSACVGAYVVTGATSTTISVTKLSDAGKGGAVPGIITAPVTVTAQAVTGTVANDLIDYGPVTVTLEAANPTQGLGKSLEINELTTGTDLLSRTAFLLGTTTAVSWVSTSATPTLLTSGTEYQAKLSVARQVDSLSEDLVAGGDVVLKVGYKGTTASVVISDTAFTVTRTGGSGADLALTLTDFPTVADLVAYLNAQTGYTAAAGTAALASLPTTALDDGTYTIGSTWGSQTGRIKADGYKFFRKVRDNSLVVQLGNPATQAVAGLPAPTAAVAFLSGGTRGATLAATFLAAITALERVRGNILVPLFSRDAASDIADGLTDSASSYAISTIHSVVKSHCLAMSKPKRKRNRQAVVGIRDTIGNALQAAANVNSGRTTVTFLDQKLVASNGVLTQFHPWADAVLAAAGTLAAGYRGIVHKVKNVSGSVQAAGDWSDQDDSDLEKALLGGLLPTKRDEAGRFVFVSDQTSYSADSNFVYNSMQAVYIADIMALTLAQDAERDFIGQAISDASRPVILTWIEKEMAEFLRLKLTAPSDDAPLGFKSPVVSISGGVASIGVEAKLNGLLYFAPITFSISQVSQSGG